MKLTCLIVDDDPISRQILKRCIASTDFLELVKECPNAIEAKKYLNKSNADLIFLDVEMPEMNGLEFISTLERKMQIILVSGEKKYAADGFEHDVTDYMNKPFTYERFLKAAEKAYRQHQQSQKGEVQEEPMLFLKVDSVWRKIQVKSIHWVEAMGDYVGIYVGESPANLKRHVIHATMKSVETKLDFEFFARVHRSYIINLKRIDSFLGDSIQIGDKQIPVGITYRNRIEELLKQFYQ